TDMNRRPGDVGRNCFSAMVVSGLLEELDHLFARLQHHVGLLPIGPLAGEASLALDLAVHVRHTHVLDLHAEQRLDRALDLRLGRVPVHLEAQRALRLLQQRRLLGHQRPPDHVVQVSHASRSSSLVSPSEVSTTCLQSSTWYALTWLGSSTTTPGR